MEITMEALLILLGIAFVAGIFVGWDVAMSLVAKREALVARSLKMLLGKRMH